MSHYPFIAGRKLCPKLIFTNRCYLYQLNLIKWRDMVKKLNNIIFERGHLNIVLKSPPDSITFMQYNLLTEKCKYKLSSFEHVSNQKLYTGRNDLSNTRPGIHLGPGICFLHFFFLKQQTFSLGWCEIWDTLSLQAQIVQCKKGLA